jgi:hypothetical protein
MESAVGIFLRNTGMSREDLREDSKWSFLLEWAKLHGHKAMRKYLEEKVDAGLSPEEIAKAIGDQMNFFMQQSGWGAEELTRAATVWFMNGMVDCALADFIDIQTRLKPLLPFSDRVLRNPQPKT